jgi:hypothetical protein
MTQCPGCRRDLNVPDLLAGQEVKCPTCGRRFEANGPADAPGPLPAAPPEIPVATIVTDDDVPVADAGQDARQSDPPGANSQGVAERPPAALPPPPPEAPQTCSYCGGKNPPWELTCCFCGESFLRDDEGRPPWERYSRRLRRDIEPHRGSLIMTLGLVSVISSAIPFLFVIGLPSGIAAWFMGQRDLKKLNARQMDPAGTSRTHSGWMCGIIGTLIHTLYAIGCAGCVGLSMMPALMTFPSSPPPASYQQGPAPVGSSPYPPWSSKPETEDPE